jgi:glycerol-3-phosphate dehydrogenase
MKRNVGDLSGQQFDVLVIGGGAAGAATAREAALRGFTTGLIERDDFGAGTSAHCFKVVHGGIRYLQHGDVRRLRASCRERAVFLRIAPHLVSAIPFAVPTYGQRRHSKWLVGTGMLLYDALSAGCNAQVIDPARRVARTRFLSRSEVLARFPSIEPRGLTGAAVFDDGQMYNPPRLVLAFAAAAHELGAKVANYIEAERLLIEGSRVVGVTAFDRSAGARLDIRSRVTINATGPWAEGLLASINSKPATPAGTYSRDAYFLVKRKIDPQMALAIESRTRDVDAVLARGGRHLFLVPWRDCTLVGVWHTVVERDPDTVSLSLAEIRRFIDELNQTCPGLALRESEVRIAGFGLVPFGEATQQQPTGLSFGKQSRLIDHRKQGNLQGIISLISVRYTVARADAVAAIDLAGEQLMGRSGMQDSTTRPLPGGDLDDFNRFLAEIESRSSGWLPRAAAASLVRNYGSRATHILALAERDPRLRACVPDTGVTYAEVAYTSREEMVERMTDVVFRRTELGTSGHPGEQALRELEEFLAHERSWTDTRRREERAAVDRHFRRYLATATGT